MKNLVFKRFMSARLLLTAIIAFTAFSSVRAIDLESTINFSVNYLGLEKGTTYPNIKAGSWMRSQSAPDVSKCNFDGLEFNGITFNGTWDCTIPTEKGFNPEGYKNNASYYDPTLRYQTSSTVGSTSDVFLCVNNYNTLSFTAPDGYSLKSVTLHYFWNNSSKYYYNGSYNNKNIIWCDGGTYSLSEDGSNGKFIATESLKTISLIAYATRAMWISSIDFTLVEVGGSGPVVTKYNVNNDNSMVGGTVVASPGKAAEGDEVTLKTQPESGYTYVDGSLTVTNDATSEAVSVSDNKFTMPASDVTVSASFTPIEYTITVKTDPRGSYGTASADKTKAHKGETVTLTATPDDGYELAGWNVDFDAVDVDLNTNTFIMPAMDVTITPIFAKPKHTVNKSVTGSGTVTLSSASVSEEDYFRVTTKPSTGYELQSIVVTDDVTNEVIAIDEEVNGYQMPAHDVTVTVVFVKSTYTITIDGNITNGTVTANKSTAQYGDVVTLTATPADGYELKSWNVTSTSGVVTVSNNQFTMPAGNVTVSATFGKKTSSSGWTFDDATFTPALNTPVESISEIKIDYNGIEPIGTSGGDNGISPFSGLVGTISNGVTSYQVYAGTDYFNEGYLTLDVMDVPVRYTITEPGTWTLHFNASSLTAYVDKSKNAEMNYTFIIAPATPEPTYTEKTLILAAKDDANNYYATFSSDKDVLFPDNEVDVYTVSVSGSKLVMNDLELGSVETVQGYKVPAGNGVLLKTKKLNTTSITYYELNSSEASVLAGNMLYPASKDKSTLANHKFYKLAYSDSSMKPESLGFYWGAANGGVFESRAGGAYLAVPSNVALAAGFSFVDDDNTTTGINEISNNADAKAIYNLNGQRVNNSVKGIVIMNGKKMLNK